MTRSQTVFFSCVLVLLGAGWGFTQPMTKISVSEGYQHFGLIFWQLVIGAVAMAVISAIRGLRLSFERRHLRLYVVIALIGTILPNSASYQAAVHLQAGVMSILYATIPMLAFPMALMLGTDRYHVRRLVGLAIGLVGVLLIVAPGAQMPGAGSTLWVFVLMITCLFYAFEGNYVARWGTEGLDALQVLFGASVIGMILALPLALLSGHWIDPRPPWGAPDLALIAGSLAHVAVYAGYVWLVGRAGAVFTVQVSYLVTLFGLLWARLILGEAYSTLIWLALGLMLVGMYLVQPRPGEKLAEGQAIQETGNAE